MLNAEVFQWELELYIIVVAIVTIVFLIVFNLFFLFLKKKKILEEQKAWIILNLAFVAMGLSHIIPAGMDIYYSSYCTIYNVIEMETTYDHGFTSVLITDSNGKIYDCGASLVEEDEIVDNASYPGTAIYAKHSGLLLRYYPSEDGTISK